ncbi:hypothetical protein GCM10009629_44430 [Pseudonocardia alni]
MTRTSEPAAGAGTHDPRRTLWELHARHATQSSVPSADVVEHILSLTDQVLDDADRREAAGRERRRDTVRIRVLLGSLIVACALVCPVAFLAGADVPLLVAAGAGLATGVALLVLDARSAGRGHRGRAGWSGVVLAAGLAGPVAGLVPGGLLPVGVGVVALLVAAGGFVAAGTRAGA